MDSIKLSIGIDDTDSRKLGMCTTYLTFKLIPQLKKLGVKFIDYPRLIRLNPNIPYKTRGNGAVNLRIEILKEKLEDLKKLLMYYLNNYSITTDKNTNPGLVVIDLNKIKKYKHWYNKGLRELIDFQEILPIIEKSSLFYYGLGNKRGLIGAFCASVSFLKDYTYELIVYRKNKEKTERKIDENSVISMDKKFYPDVFDNVDYEYDTILIAPRGPDPVLVGIRGENPKILLKAFKKIKILERIEGYCIFKTNQATDAHIEKKKIKDIKPYNSVRVFGIVSKDPIVLPGSHVKISIKDETGEIDCMAYFETGKSFRKVISSLKKGDVVEVFGSIGKYKNTINLEKIHIIKLAKVYEEKNPVCPNCGKRMHSMGKNKGFKCKKCGYKNPNLKKEKIEIKRDIIPGFYEVAPDARRHLSKPLIRYGKEKWLL